MRDANRGAAHVSELLPSPDEIIAFLLDLQLQPHFLNLLKAQSWVQALCGPNLTVHQEGRCIIYESANS